MSANFNLEHINESDRELMINLYCRPTMMKYLGPIFTEEMALQSLAKVVAGNRAKERCSYKIIVENGISAGTVGFWKSKLDDQNIVEMGWMILDEFQGQGLATEATRTMIRNYLSTDFKLPAYAFIPKGNEASTAICRKLGFKHIKSTERSYKEHHYKGDLWQFDLLAL